jgi:dihydrofolate reductase
MRKMLYFVNITMDGFISGPDGSLDWAIADKQLHEAAIDLLNSTDIILFGRKTYQLMLDYWPAAENDPSMPDYMVAFAKTLNPMKKVVFSKTLKNVGWNTTLKKEIDFEEMRRMKKQKGKDIGIDGASVAQQFMREGLIDELQLLVHPVVLGAGKPLFSGLKRIDFELMGEERFASGVVMLKYRLKKG